MKLTDILKEIESIQPDTFENATGRRNILKGLGMKVAAIATPFAAASLLSNKASAKTTDVLAEAIVFALNISYMQSALYAQALAQTGLIPAAAVNDFKNIQRDKSEHIAYWIYQLQTTGNAVPTPPSYDFTAKNALPKAMSDYGTFLTVAHAIEDAGVRMYLTAVQMLLTNKAFRTDAVNMATTNARHAAHVRMQRRNQGIDMQPWVVGTEQNSLVGEIKKAYQNEDNTIQLKINTVGINGFAISFDAATGAFDEPMSEADAKIFMTPFIV
eukprot:TRINITY_DN99478_c0_g1_i1.p1 TRINITY_DN99478_c0_g1~~TRINITY_DN99478_c0_g1_i1.p1  ORF type:complete len:271 (-),score=36.28 TRINITY_DN99478_c0_g1_i1:7-819(-)